MNQTNKKILFATRLYHPHIGGVEKHVNKITRELLLKKKQVTIVTELYDTQLKQKEQFQKHLIYRIPTGGGIFLKKFYIWVWFIRNISLIKDADIIHMHDVAYWLLPFKIVFPRKRFYVTFHGYEDYPIRKKWIVQRKIVENLVNGSICIGEFMRKWYHANPTKVIYGGVDIPQNIKANEIKIDSVFFGRFEQQTNVLEYAKAAKDLKGIMPKFKALFIGDGPLLKKIKGNFVIEPPNPNIEKVISGSRYVFVSRYLSMFEALSRKKLIFAYYDNPIKKDYLLKSPFREFIITVNSKKKLTDRVLYFKKNPHEEKALVEKGFNWVKDYTWRRVAEEYLDLWKSS